MAVHSSLTARLDQTVSISPPETVREILLRKHPPKQSPKQSSIITPDAPIVEPHPVLFDKIDGLLIRNTVLRMDGTAGPSGLDWLLRRRLGR